MNLDCRRRSDRATAMLHTRAKDFLGSVKQKWRRERRIQSKPNQRPGYQTEKPGLGHDVRCHSGKTRLSESESVGIRESAAVATSPCSKNRNRHATLRSTPSGRDRSVDIRDWGGSVKAPPVFERARGGLAVLPTGKKHAPKRVSQSW